MDLKRRVKKIFSHYCSLSSNRVRQFVNLNELPKASMHRSSSKKKEHCNTNVPQEHRYLSIAIRRVGPSTSDMLTICGCALTKKASSVDPQSLAPVMYRYEILGPDVRGNPGLFRIDGFEWAATHFIAHLVSAESIPRRVSEDPQHRMPGIAAIRHLR